MLRRTTLAAAALATAAGVSGLGLALDSASAAPSVVTATTSVSGHPDTTSPTPPAGAACKPSPGGPVWALDAYTSTLTAVPSGAGTWDVTIADAGSFQGFADPATCDAELSSGSFLFLYTVKVASPNAPAPADLHSSYTTQSTAQMVTDLFGGSATVTGGDYFASYQGGRYVQTTSTIYGDVAPAPAPVLSLRYCGSHVWRVAQNASLVATKFRYFSDLPGRGYVLDGAATVGSGASVKVPERPHAAGGLEVRYPSAGRTVTVVGSRTPAGC